MLPICLAALLCILDAVLARGADAISENRVLSKTLRIHSLSISDGTGTTLEAITTDSCTPFTPAMANLRETVVAYLEHRRGPEV
jgi:hypothetical protein